MTEWVTFYSICVVVIPGYILAAAVLAWAAVKFDKYEAVIRDKMRNAAAARGTPEHPAAAHSKTHFLGGDSAELMDKVLSVASDLAKVWQNTK